MQLMQGSGPSSNSVQSMWRQQQEWLQPQQQQQWAAHLCSAVVHSICSTSTPSADVLW